MNGTRGRAAAQPTAAGLGMPTVPGTAVRACSSAHRHARRYPGVERTTRAIAAAHMSRAFCGCPRSESSLTYMPAITGEMVLEELR